MKTRAGRAKEGGDTILAITLGAPIVGAAIADAAKLAAHMMTVAKPVAIEAGTDESVVVRLAP